MLFQLIRGDIWSYQSRILHWNVTSGDLNGKLRSPVTITAKHLGISHSPGHRFQTEARTVSNETETNSVGLADLQQRMLTAEKAPWQPPDNLADDAAEVEDSGAGAGATAAAVELSTVRSTADGRAAATEGAVCKSANRSSNRSKADPAGDREDPPDDALSV